MLWFTGLSGAGKSTLALALERELFAKGYQVYVLDGDNIRARPQRQSGLQPGGPGREHPPRRRGGRPCSPMPASSSSARSSRPTAPTASGRGPRPRTRSTRSTSRRRSPPAKHRDPKGLYKRARKGEIAEFTGISSPYEAPDHADLVVPTDELPIDECLVKLIRYVEEPPQA